MSNYVYVAVQDDDKILVSSMDAETGKLTVKSEAAVPGGPFVLAISPDRKTLYAGHRSVPELSSWSIDQGSGALTKNGTVIPEDAPVYISTDRSGKHLLSSFYGSGHAAVHPIGDDGTLGAGDFISRGFPVLVQEPVTCVVDGMPGAAIAARVVSAVMDVEQLGGRLRKWGVTGESTARAMGI